MENQAQKDDHAEAKAEEFPDEFQCCVCLDIMYKPVVLACGHISCFWCVFKAMDSLQESHCPVCRNPYIHFPRVCTLLHFLLLKFYPLPYKRRERQVAEEEKEFGQSSPQFEDSLFDPHINQVLDVQDTSLNVNAVPFESSYTNGRDISSDQFSSESTSENKSKCIVKENDTSDSRKELLLTYLQCAECKNLLYRPVVLNCGHVYCAACINTPKDSVCRCPICQSEQPNGVPNVCLVLVHFLEEHFAEEYCARKESMRTNLMENLEQGSQGSPMPADIWSGHGPKFHPGVGCDYCGMSPIIGERYRCKDCVEEIGFDLCERCYNSSSKLPGRFNQQHTQDHEFEVVESSFNRNEMLTLGAEYREEYDGNA